MFINGADLERCINSISPEHLGSAEDAFRITAKG